MPRAAVAPQQLIGVPVKRKEDIRHITGRGNFIDDITLPGMLYAAILRSPYAHARIKRIDTSRAEKLPGVVATLTGEEVAKMSFSFPQMTLPPASNVKDYCMAVGKAKYAGEPVAAVVAESRYIAEDALEIIDVEYEELPPVLDAEKAIEPGSPVVHDEAGSNVIAHLNFDYGDVDRAFKQADFIIKAKFHYHRFSSAPLENYAAVVLQDPASHQLTIWCNNQMPMFFLPQFGRALNVAFDKIHIIAPDIGGGFGVKILSYPYIVLTALLSRKIGRPVKWIEERREHLAASSHGNERTIHAEAAVRKDGTILGIKAKTIDDDGAYARHEPASSVIWAQVSPGCCKFKNLRMDVYAVFTDKCPVGPNRGYSRAQHQFMIERLLDRIARRLKLDPTVVRFRNYIKREDHPYITPNGCIYDGGDYSEAIRRTMKLIKYKGWRRKQAELRKQGRLIGIGIACALDSGANNFAQVQMINRALPLTGNSEAATVRVTPDGKVVVTLGTVPQGQAHETTTAQLVAQELGVSVDEVTVGPGFDSASHPYTLHSGTYASRFSVLGLNAAQGAAKRVREKILKIASHFLKVSPKRLAIANGEVHIEGSKKKGIGIRRIARYAYGNIVELPARMEPGLYATYVYRPPFKSPNMKNRGNLTMSYSYQAHAAVLEVDSETGKVRILDYAIVDDCGRIINPLIVEGQVHGAAAHGIGAALFEEFRYDENGQLLTSTFMDYMVPSAMDLSDIKTANMEIPSLINPIGAKGVGEGGGTPLQAIANAVEDALSPFGIEFDDSHVAPEKILTLLEKHGKTRAT